MKNRPKVSIIVPVYNVEKYLAQCLDSLAAQTLKDIEIICVNDGSTDSSLTILKKYADKDARIILISKENGGLSSARNSGIKVAKGEYIGFVDSDDWVDIRMYESLYKTAAKNKADISMCSVRTIDESTGKILDYSYYDLNCFLKYLGNDSFNLKKLDYWLFSLPVIAVNKIYKTSLIKNKILFIEGIKFEDTPFYFEAILSANLVSVVRDKLYNYRINRTDSITSKKSKDFDDIYGVVDVVEHIFKKKNLYHEYKRNLIEQHISMPTLRFLQLDRKSQVKSFGKLKEFIKTLNLNNDDLNKIYYESSAFYISIIGSKTFYDMFIRLKYNQLRHWLLK